MKAKTLVACALTVSAFAAAPALAQNAEPAGPQGTGWYGAPNAALPVPQIVYPYTYYERTDMRREGRRWVYQGNSFDTNPPVPAP
jgi:hypothetical protein